MKKYTIADIVIISVVMLVSGAVVTYAVMAFGLGWRPIGDNNSFLSKVSAIKNVIDERYYENADEKVLTDNAASGLLGGLGDKYSDYYTKEQWKLYEEHLNGMYKGIGAVISLRNDDRIEIIRVFKSSPAEQAGLKKGDILLMVNEVEANADNDEKVTQIIQDATDNIHISVERSGKTLDFEVMTKELKQSNLLASVIDDEIGYIRIYSFDSSIATVFKKKLEKLEKENISSLVIDVRDNPGGDLDQVASICDQLLGECTILYTQTKDGEQKFYNSDKAMFDKPIVLLVNENSASASEVIAGALRDNKWATLIGKKTYGKGVVQNVFELNDGSGFTLTVARYYTPSGECIHGKGILPDITVDDQEGQLKEAIKTAHELVDASQARNGE